MVEIQRYITIHPNRYLIKVLTQHAGDEAKSGGLGTKERGNAEENTIIPFLR